MGKPIPKPSDLKDVELGKNYALVINTNGGLWRYLLGDTIQFTPESLSHQGERTAETFYQCIWGRSDCRQFR